MCSGIFQRQRLDVDLVQRRREHAALADAGSVVGTDEMHTLTDAWIWLVERDLLQVDVRIAPADLVDLLESSGDELQRRSPAPSISTSRIEVQVGGAGEAAPASRPATEMATG